MLNTGCGVGLSTSFRDAASEGGGKRALARYDAQEHSDDGLVGALAAGVLLHEAGSGNADRRAIAFAHLRALGTRAEGLLLELKEDARPPVRVRALAALGQLGLRWARSQAREARFDPDPEVAAAAYQVLSPRLDLEQLQAALRTPHASLRLAAAQRLRQAEPGGTTLLALGRCARNDPDERVRLACVQGMGQQGPRARRVLLERLFDSAQPVRLGAIAALAQVDQAQALPALDRYLGGDPSPEAVAAARALLRNLTPARPPPAGALSMLARSVQAPDAAVRSRAALALTTLPMGLRPLEAVRTQLQAEPRAAVRLNLALLLPAQDMRRVTTLRAMMCGTGVPAAQAAAQMLAQDKNAEQRLAALLTSKSTAARRVAAIALAPTEGGPHRSRALLADPSPSTRVAVAAAILRGRHPSAAL